MIERVTTANSTTYVQKKQHVSLRTQQFQKSRMETGNKSGCPIESVIIIPFAIGKNGTVEGLNLLLYVGVIYLFLFAPKQQQCKKYIKLHYLANGSQVHSPCYIPLCSRTSL